MSPFNAWDLDPQEVGRVTQEYSGLCRGKEHPVAPLLSFVEQLRKESHDTEPNPYAELIKQLKAMSYLDARLKLSRPLSFKQLLQYMCAISYVHLKACSDLHCELQSSRVSS